MTLKKKTDCGSFKEPIQIMGFVCEDGVVMRMKKLSFFLFVFEL